MNNTIRKTVIGLCIAVNVAAMAAIGVVMHQRYVAGHTIDLGTIVVTPTPAQLHEVAANRVIDLGVVTVTPTAEQLQYAANMKANNDSEAQAADLPAFESLVQSLESLAPGQYLDNSADVAAFATLAFERLDR